MSEQRKPIDGVECLVWTEGGAMHRANWRADLSGWLLYGWNLISESEVTHWTTLAECKAAPGVVEALRSLLTTVEHMRSPQTVDDVALLVMKFLGPVECARDALASIEKENA